MALLRARCEPQSQYNGSRVVGENPERSQRRGRALMIVRIVLALLAFSAATFAVRADDLKVLTTGAMKPVLLEVAPGFQQESKQNVSLDNDTAGALLKQIQAGAAFDVVVL